jgi:U3 small nucleolar RNA-associated protein 22
MIDPTDSSGSEVDDDESGSKLADDAEDDEVEEFDGDDDAGEQDGTTINTSNGIGALLNDTTSTSGPSRPAQQPPKTKSKSLYAPATADELDRLRSAQETGNTFTLQLEDLVSRTLLPVAPHAGTKDLLSKLHDLILGLPTLAPVSPREAMKRTKDIPWAGGKEWSPTRESVNWTLGWEKPGEVFVGGSWAVVGGYKRGKGMAGDVDLVVVMPKVSP